jgi:hypothetical protein
MSILPRVRSDSETTNAGPDQYETGSSADQSQILANRRARAACRLAVDSETTKGVTIDD